MAEYAGLFPEFEIVSGIHSHFLYHFRSPDNPLTLEERGLADLPKGASAKAVSIERIIADELQVVGNGLVLAGAPPHIIIMGAQQRGDSLPAVPGFFELSARTIEGEVMEFSLLKGAKLVLVVNVACRAPRAAQHFSNLVHLYQAYERQGLEILAFPSNAFGNELATDPEI